MKSQLAILLVLLLLSACTSIVKTVTPSSPVNSPQQGIYHVVKTGENLFRIGKAYDVSYEELARLNGMRDASQIFVGQRIFIPRAGGHVPVEIITPSEPVRSRPAVGPEPFEPRPETFLWPISGTINSAFGPRGSSFHDGIDIAAPEGTPIRAIEHGEVIYSDQLKGYGNIIIVRHAEGLISVYAHNEANLVIQGQQVSRGEMIARVGSTGRVTGPHLHFEIRKNNLAQDPIRYLPQLCCLPPSDTVAPERLRSDERISKNPQ